MLPSLGILYVASAVRDAGAETFLWDMNYSADPPVEDVDILMVTANTATWPVACEAAERVKAPLKVIGGPHVSSLGLQGPFDVACIGEGEAVAARIVEDTRRGRRLPATLSHPPLSLDDVAWPAYDLWPELGQASAVAVEGGDPGPGTSIATSRGCPFACRFCNEDMWGRRVRFRSVEDVLAEAAFLRDRFGITQLRIQDDVANLDKRRFVELCRGLHDLGFIWRINSRTDQVSRDEFRMMKETGCVEVALGVETGSQRMLDLMGKGNTVANNERAIGWAADVGVYSRIFLIVGFPGETWESVEETVAFLRRVRPHRAVVSAFVPYPGCAVWKNPQAFGCTIEDTDWGGYWAQNLEDDEGFPCAFPSMSRDELRRARKMLIAECELLYGSADRRREVLEPEGARTG